MQPNFLCHPHKWFKIISEEIARHGGINSIHAQAQKSSRVSVLQFRLVLFSSPVGMKIEINLRQRSDGSILRRLHARRILSRKSNYGWNCALKRENGIKRCDTRFLVEFHRASSSSESWMEAFLSSSPRDCRRAMLTRNNVLGFHRIVPSLPIEKSDQKFPFIIAPLALFEVERKFLPIEAILSSKYLL